VICADGAKHTMRLTEVEPGTPNSREAKSIHLGPNETVWVRLPAEASLAQDQPIAVPDLNADELELQIKRSDGSRQSADLAVQRRPGEGLTPVDLIQARIEIYSYAMPADCRVMSDAETNNHALALLNNAGCLLPADAHAALNRIPGAYGRMQADCGWVSDTEAAIRTLTKSADRGSIHAGWVLSQFYLGNVDPSYQNHAKAYRQLNQAAGLGHASADLMAAVMHWRGNGVKRDAGAAFADLLPHARTGSREAQGIIGTMYLTGEGAPVNFVHAYAWCSLAATGGPLMHADAESCRDAAAAELSYDKVLDARDLAVDIHNGDY
jgi:TPR repeat protein